MPKQVKGRKGHYKLGLSCRNASRPVAAVPPTTAVMTAARGPRGDL
jgi:hypothetical protein